ncbi:hypothetical protein BST36_19140 [Mycolicibacterium moriokaense]|uniref:Uncharacterized protein n=1 Tax=Mycolicibacterium moriokaense TaxID=39691 RepID=A0AAD1M5A3_9MYCO|nr:hypothetical protein [Mycolicibacterium moriokaense]MCV7039102.1 hypothetical protein [Mycolicibacterium moriokaense]ORB20321.1 hypothetical protein BST36_19140 [Mycolicibacterium moriokaense]BBX00004.1 hypothetical protein MMOR_09400 [Mycolicibacterium moriokaense]
MRRPTIYRISHRLRGGLTVAAWLADLGANSPLPDDLEKAVHAGDWPAARALGDYLSVDVTVAH